jgi:hypothetical protein
MVFFPAGDLPPDRHAGYPGGQPAGRGVMDAAERVGRGVRRRQQPAPDAAGRCPKR